VPDPNPNRDRRGRFAPKNRGGGLAALALVLAVAAGGGGAAVGSAVSGTGTSAAGRTATGTQAKARDRSTLRTVQRLQSNGLEVTPRATDADDNCATNSYGQVQNYFRQNPCAALYRAVFEVRDGPATAQVAVAWVDMPSEAQAVRYQQLVDRHGTGNVSELSSDVRWTGMRYTSVRDGVTVVNVQAEPVGATAAAVGLAQRAAGGAIG
jgi:hypothetical protein